MNVNDKEFESVIRLPAPKRYEYLIKKVADWEEIWSIGDQEGWAVAGDDEGGKLIPIWPHSRYAAACCHDGWASYQPKMITLDDWMKKWLIKMPGDNLKVAAFPTPDNQGIPVDPETMLHHLESEMEKY